MRINELPSVADLLRLVTASGREVYRDVIRKEMAAAVASGKRPARQGAGASRCS
jgi:hypothetical protein